MNPFNNLCSSFGNIHWQSSLGLFSWNRKRETQVCTHIYDVGHEVCHLLPCGIFDKVTKFTGSDDIAPAADAMTKAIHAFTHFSYVYSKGFWLFCDLQGKYDNGGWMCLFDPQVHMYVILLFVIDHILIILPRNQNRPDRDAYWDGGMQKIKKILKQHENDCERNRVCNALELHTMLVNDHSAPKEQQRSKKPTIINLIN